MVLLGHTGCLKKWHDRHSDSWRGCRSQKLSPDLEKIYICDCHRCENFFAVLNNPSTNTCRNSKYWERTIWCHCHLYWNMRWLALKTLGTMDDDERLRTTPRPEPGPGHSWLCTGGRAATRASQLRPLSLPPPASGSRFTLANWGTVYLNWLFVFTLFTVLIGSQISCSSSISVVSKVK